MRAQSPIATAPSATTDRRITELHLWAVREGLRRAPAATLFEDFCRRLAAAGVPLWRAFVGMRTLHPQWAGYTYTWWRDRDLVHPVRRVRGEEYDQDLRDSPYLYLLNAAGSRDVPLRLRRRLAGGGAQRDFPILEELAIAGATDYFAELIPVGMVTEAFPDNGIGFSFATDHPEGFGNDDLQLIEAVLPAVSLAIVSDVEHTIAAGLLAAYLGGDAGRRVHAGVVERGSVESIRAVLWYADIRGFTPIADATPGPVLVEMLDDIFETLTAALRPHGGEVLNQIDFATATLHVRRVKRGTPATHPILGDELRALRRVQREQEPRSPFVFVSERGAPFTTAGFSRIVERAGAEAKLGFKSHPHMLRHACGYALANKGHDTRALQAYLGHKDIQHTVRYTELSPSRFKDFWRTYYDTSGAAIEGNNLPYIF